MHRQLEKEQGSDIFTTKQLYRTQLHKTIQATDHTNKQIRLTVSRTTTHKPIYHKFITHSSNHFKLINNFNRKVM